jgi:hypothetical protein
MDGSESNGNRESREIGVRAFLYHLLGFVSGFKSVFVLQDLSHDYQSFRAGKKLNEETSIIAVQNLAHLHSLSWKKTDSLHIPNEFADPKGYKYLFNLDPNLLSKIRLSKEKMETRLSIYITRDK